MSSQEVFGKGAIGKSVPGGSHQGTSRGKKHRSKARWYKKKGLKHKKNARDIVSQCKGDPARFPSDSKGSKSFQSGEKPHLSIENIKGNLVEDQNVGSGNNDIIEDKETEGESCTPATKNTNIEDNSSEPGEKLDIMESSSQSGDQKNKLLEMMSREFNSASIHESSVPLEPKKSGRVPRVTRKRKSEVIDKSEKNPDASTSQPTPVTTSSPVVQNPITSALKKIRKESIENLPSPITPSMPARTRRSTQERKSGSEKDPSEDVGSVSEASETLKSKTDDVSTSEKSTPDTRGRKRARVRGKPLIEGEEGNDSGTESPVTPFKGRGKTRSSSEEDAHLTRSDSPVPSSATKGRVRSRGFTESETITSLGRGRGKGKCSLKEEQPGTDGRGRGKQKADVEKTEDQLDTSAKFRGRGKVPYEDNGNPVNNSNNSPVTMATRSRGKTDVDKEGPLETEAIAQQRRSMTPVRGETTPQSELKRSQRISLSRESSLESPLASKKVIQKTIPEMIKKQEIASVAKLPLNRPKKEGEDQGITKTGKKKKKHFKGLSYSFSAKKKKGKGKIGFGKHGLDTSQETDSVVSEEIDIESIDSSSQDVPSEQLSNQDQDGVDDRLSEGGENDIEMDNVDTPDPSGEGENESIAPQGSLKTGVVGATDNERDTSPNVDKKEAANEKLHSKEKSVEEKCEESEEPKAGELSEGTEKCHNVMKEAKVTEENIEKDVISQDKTTSEGNEVVTSGDTSATCEAESKGEHEEVILSKVKSEDVDHVKVSKEERASETDLYSETRAKGDAEKKQEECNRKSLKVNNNPPGSPVFSSPTSESRVVQGTVVSQQTEKDSPTSLVKVSSTPPDIACSASESAFSPVMETDLKVPEEGGGGDASDMKLEGAASHLYAKGSDDGSPEHKSLTNDKTVCSPQGLNKTHCKDSNREDLMVRSAREPVAINDQGMRHLGRRRQSISKRKLEDLVTEGHNSDSSDSLSEARPPGEGVRKSKRLSRHSSPHPLSFAAPESPEGAGKSQSKPISSQSAYVTPASPEEHHCYILSPPVNLTQSCQQQGIVQSAAPTLTNVLCKCRIKSNPLAVVTTGEVYCQAFDSFDGRMIGCCNIVSNYRYLRVSGKIPFMLLCDNHRQRLRRHNCCPCCGLFCTQGVFYECAWDKNGPRHYYHKLCSLVLNGTTLCPHCGSAEPPREVQLEFKLTRKPVIYLKQHQERKESSARMTWSKKEMSEGDDAQPDSVAEDEPTLELRNGRIISALKLPLSCGREKLQEAIRCISDGKAIHGKPSNKGICAACKQNDVDKLLHCLVSGMNPNIKVKECGTQTGLHVAAEYGSIAALHILVLAGATIDMTDNQLMTPLMIAITKEQNEVVHYLIQAGASLMAKTQDGMTCLHLAAKCGNIVACQHILESGRLSRHAINMQDEGGWTPLVWASENKFINVVKFLLDRGGNPQLCDVEQNTALHWAAFSGSTHICSMVLDRGCSLRSMNAHGDTPLHIAARQNHTDAVVLLLTRGARLDVLNSKSQTPIDCALSDSDVYLQLTLNSKVLEMMKQNNIRTEKILSSDIAGGKEEVPIPCVNGVDEDQLPKDYLYIAENCEASNVIIDRTITSLKWCECEDGCNAEHCGCGQLNFQCWFDPDGRLLPEFNYADPPMIFECNRACRCNKLTCNNRVVQHGISAHMQLFKTSGKGWGVRALKTIQKGSYVCEYVGEIITDLEADQRQDDSYLFDLDNRDSETFCIDARSYGNIARFINHLCEANLTPVKVFIDHQDLTFPRIAFFANRDIEADEELGFDYGEKFWMIKYKHFTCTCSSEKCKYSSETIQTTLENYNRKLRELQEAAY